MTSHTVRTLDVVDELPSGHRFISAASGLAIVGDLAVVVADDAHHLGIFPVATGLPGWAARIVDGDLPSDRKERKRRKPDFEAVLPVPGARSTLLVVGSGSTPERERALVVEIGADGGVTVDRALDLAALSRPLREWCDDVNVEAAFVDRDEMVLISRAHAGQPQNLVARYPLPSVAVWLEGRDTAEIRPTSVVRLVPTPIDNVPLGVTDAASLGRGWWVFSAVAEHTANSYDDGAVAGCVAGVVDPEGRVARLARLDRVLKVEGIAAVAAGDRIDITMVTDADDPDVPGEMLRATF